MLRTTSAQPGMRSRQNGAERVFSLDDWLYRAARVIATCLRRSRTRRALSELSDHHLRDVGLSRFDAVQEANKPFWR